MVHFKSRRIALALLARGALLALASQAQAHAHLVGATPAPNAALSSGVKAITLRFNEPVMARFSGLDITGQNGAKVATSPVSVDAKGRKALTASLTSPLAPGAYKVSWHVVSADTHKMQGAYSFRVH